MGIATSHSHSEMLQDMVLKLSEASSTRDSESDKHVLRELVKEMVAFRCSTDDVCSVTLTHPNGAYSL